MKVFVTGVGGQLGYDVMNELHQRGIESIGSDVLPEVTSIDAPYYSLDITDGAAVSAMLEKLKPDAVIHCAAWTAVDAAEDEDKQETVRKVNVEGTKNIAAECGALDIPMIIMNVFPVKKNGSFRFSLDIANNSHQSCLARTICPE